MMNTNEKFKIIQNEFNDNEETTQHLKRGVINFG